MDLRGGRERATLSEQMTKLQNSMQNRDRKRAQGRQQRKREHSDDSSGMHWWIFATILYISRNRNRNTFSRYLSYCFNSQTAIFSQGCCAQSYCCQVYSSWMPSRNRVWIIQSQSCVVWQIILVIDGKVLTLGEIVLDTCLEFLCVDHDDTLLVVWTVCCPDWTLLFCMFYRRVQYSYSAQCI